MNAISNDNTQNSVLMTRNEVGATGLALASSLIMLIVLGMGLMIVGFVAEILSSTVQPEFKEIKWLENGGVVNKTVLVVSTWSVALKVFSSFCYSLSIALVISIVVTHRLEADRMSKRENQLTSLHDRINESVFESLFKRFVPDEIFSAVKEQIVTNNFVQKNVSWKFEFSESNGKVKLKQTISGEYHNLTHSQFQTLPFAEVDNSYSNEKLLKYTCLLDGIVIGKYDWKEPEKGMTVTNLSPKHEKLTIKIEIPPRKHVDVLSIWETEFEAMPFQDANFALYPIINASLNVTIPKGHEFHLFESYSKQMTLSLKEDNMEAYTMKGVILSGQGFVYGLKKKVSTP